MGFFSMIKSSSEFKIALIVIFLFLSVEVYYFSQLRYLPGPIYGGDIYSHHGFALNYLNNGFWTDPYFRGEYAFYPWLGNYLFIFLSAIAGISLKTAINFTPLITTVLGAVAFYFLGKILFKSGNKAILTMVLWVVYRKIPEAAPNNIPWLITIPLWFYFWLKVENSSNLKDKIFAGVFMGITALSHVAFFIAGLFVFVFSIILENFIFNFKNGFILNVREFIRKYFVVFLVGFLISLFFYWPITYFYNAHTKNPLFQYNGPDIDTLGVGYVFSETFKGFARTGDLIGFVISILSLIGLIVCILNYKKKELRFVLWWFIAGTIAPLHHLITRPLFGKWTLPTHLWGVSIAMFVFFMLGVQFLLSVKFSGKIKNVKYFIVGVVILLLFYYSVKSYNENPWIKAGREQNNAMDAWWGAGDWIQKNTEINDVFLAFDESCFAMNAVSGRKCVITRRTHANYFVNIEDRMADAVVALFGSNESQTEEIIKKYNISYFLVDPMLISGYQRVLPEYESYLLRNSVKFVKVVDRLDPSLNEAKKFDVLAVQFQNLTINKFLEPAIEFKVDGSPYLQIFKVKK